MGCVSGKIKLSFDERLALEVSKIKGQDIEVKLIHLIDDYQKLDTESKAYVRGEIKKYLES